MPFQRDVPKEFHSRFPENGKIIPKIEVVWGKWELGNNWHVNSLHEEMGSVPREEDETSVMAGALQLEQHGELCVNCSKNIELPPSGLSQWGTVCVRVRDCRRDRTWRSLSISLRSKRLACSLKGEHRRKHGEK